MLAVGCDEGLSPALWAWFSETTSLEALLHGAFLPPFWHDGSLLEPEPGLLSDSPVASSVKEMSSECWGHMHSDREHEQQPLSC